MTKAVIAVRNQIYGPNLNIHELQTHKRVKATQMLTIVIRTTPYV